MDNLPKINNKLEKMICKINVKCVLLFCYQVNFLVQMAV